MEAATFPSLASMVKQACGREKGKRTGGAAPGRGAAEAQASESGQRGRERVQSLAEL